MAEEMVAQVFYEPEKMALEHIPVPVPALADGLVKVDPLRSHTYKLAELEKAIGSVRNKRANPMKVLVNP